MFAVHDAVRRDLARTVSLTGGTALVAPVRAEALRSRWDLLAGVVAAHEQAEDEVLWPKLRAVLPVEEHGPLDVADEQQEGLFRALAVTTERFAVADAFTDRARREELATAAEHAAVLADHHFGLEERRLLPLVVQWLDLSDWKAFVAAWAAHPGPGGPERVLPFLLDGAHPDRAASLLAGLDEAGRAACAAQWRPAYKAGTADLW
jgi:hypothetical protein